VKPIIIDVDTGTDDALAILYAVRHPDLDVRGISCVIGNVSVDQAVINTCKVLDAASAADIPVAAGAAQPLTERTRREGGGSHGPDGLAGIQQLAGEATRLFYMTDEGSEGKDAFLEKRKPDFSKYPRLP